MDLKWVEPLFVLSTEQKNRVEMLEEYEIYFCMLRHEFLDNPAPLGAMVDLFYYLYEEQEPYLNTEISMYYLLRNFVIDLTIKNGTLKKLRTYTVGNIERTLLSAVLITNVILDIYRIIRPSFDIEDINFIRKYVKRPKKLFSIDFRGIEEYPKHYVLIETALLQKMREYTSENAVLVDSNLKAVVSFIQDFSAVNKQVFNEYVI